jgi:hypothetical protein
MKKRNKTLMIIFLSIIGLVSNFIIGTIVPIIDLFSSENLIYPSNALRLPWKVVIVLCASNIVINIFLCKRIVDLIKIFKEKG